MTGNCITKTNSAHSTSANVVAKTRFYMSATRFGLCFLLAAICTNPLLQAQDSASAPGSTQVSVPTISFTFDFPGSEPDHYLLQVGSDGRAAYQSTAKLNPDSEDTDAFHLNFTVSDAVRKKIFDLAARASYFRAPLESKRRVASTGSKTLAYKDSQRSAQATYNYSQIPAVQELTTVFQNMSTTLEFGRRLQYDHRYQKLALDAELKRMEEMAKSNSLDELQAVGPILSQIAADPSVINVVRARAQRLLAMAGASSAR